MPSPPDHPTAPGRRGSPARLVVELLISLAVLVTLFRTFLARGYLIETGSMAPCLVGVHWQEQCPDCGYSFAVEGSRNGLRAACPNCGRSGLAIEEGLQHDGDHLLVDRGAFDYRAPRRWEVVVFRNPSRLRQTYVKRLIGLPGETVELRHGDLYVNGVIQPKPYAAQRGMRILVYDNSFRPAADDPEWQPRWIPTEPDRGWSAMDDGFEFNPSKFDTSRDDASGLAWVAYRHWIRSGGQHRTSVPLEEWPAEIPQPDSSDPLSFESKSRSLICRGVLSDSLRDRLLDGSDDPRFLQAIRELDQTSHLAPVTDQYGYNRGDQGGGDYEVRDLMVEGQVTVRSPAGEFLIEISDGTATMQCLWDFAQGQVRLIDVGTQTTVRTAQIAPGSLAAGARVEVSLMDHQALVAVDGRLLCEPWSYESDRPRGSTPWIPVRLGSRGQAVAVDRLRLFRDVYYTPGGSTRGPRTAWRLGSDEYFVLGDNSPISRDSRSWPGGVALRGEMFLGKPLLVHLPSRRSRIGWGSWQTEIRIPEITRIRYVQ
ncbi:MAG: signal peptidase I [Planctomycetales bacterium]